MKLFRNKALLKVVLSIILIAIAAYLSFVALPNMYESQRTTVDVVQLQGTVVAGTRITENMLTMKSVGAFGVDGSVVKDKKDIVGKYAAYPIRKETLLYTDQFVEEYSDADGAAEMLLKDGDQLMTVSIAAASSVGGIIKTGSIVDIYTQAIETEPTVDEFGYVVDDDMVKMELTPILKDVRVYKVLNANLGDVTALTREWTALKEAGDSASEDFGSSLIPAYVTLIVNADQAQKLAMQEYNGVIHLVLSPDKTSEAAVKAPVDDGEGAAETPAPAAKNEESSGLLDNVFGGLGF